MAFAIGNTFKDWRKKMKMYRVKSAQAAAIIAMLDGVDFCKVGNWKLHQSFLNFK